MANLLWPGDDRAGEVFGDRDVVAEMIRAERAWLEVLVELRLAPPDARCQAWPAADDVEVSGESEAAGNPVVPLVSALRRALPEPAATWVHRGLTSQDVIDTALMSCTAKTIEQTLGHLRLQASTLVDLIERHRDTPMLARTLTQPAAPSTVGVQLAGWLDGLLDAVDGLRGARRMLRVQAGGAVGTLAAVVELARGRGLDDPVEVAMRSREAWARRLELDAGPVWHSGRAPFTTLGDALAGCTDAYGRIARDVLTGSRAESGEFGERSVPGRGGSSTMPDKQNPVLSVLLHRAALAAPGLSATLHVAAGSANDARPDGSWHVEWDTLRTLARRTLVAADQATELLAGLRIDATAMARHLAAADGAGGEQRAMADLTGAEPAGDYTGVSARLTQMAVERARAFVEGGAR